MPPVVIANARLVDVVTKVFIKLPGANKLAKSTLITTVSRQCGMHFGDKGIAIGRERTARLMRWAGLHGESKGSALGMTRAPQGLKRPCVIFLMCYLE